MSDASLNTPSGGDLDTGGDHGDDKIIKPEEPKDSVSYSSHKKLLTEKKNIAERLAEKTRKLDEIEKQFQDEEEKKLKEKEDYKRILELRDEEVKQLKNEKNTNDLEWINVHKTSAVVDFINDKYSASFKKKFLGHLDLDEIVIDPETKRPDAESVQKFCGELMTNYPEYMDRKDGPRMPNNATRNSTTGLTHKEWKALPSAKEMKERKKDVVDWPSQAK